MSRESYARRMLCTFPRFFGFLTVNSPSPTTSPIILPLHPSPGSACMKYFGCAKTRACHPLDFSSIIILSQHLEPKCSQAVLCLTNLSRAIAIQPLRNWHPPRINKSLKLEARVVATHQHATGHGDEIKTNKRRIFWEK